MNRSRRPVAHLVGVALLVALPVVLLGVACADGSSEDRSQDPPRTTTDRPTPTTSSTVPDAVPGGRDYVDTLATALASGASGGLPVEAEAARCLAPRWVATLGEDRLVEAGVTPEELASGYGADTSAALDEILDDDAAQQMVAAFAACSVDVERLFVAALSAGRELPADQQECLVGAFPDGFVERAMVIGLSEGQAALEANIELNDTLTAAARTCVPG